MGLRKSADLRYGENQHQQGALYASSGARPWGVNQAHLICGQPLSFNHYFDLDAAWELAGGFEEPACAIVKHGVPAGAAVSKSLAEAAKLAYRGDPRGCLRGTAAVNREVDESAADFFEYPADARAAPAAVDISRSAATSTMAADSSAERLSIATTCARDHDRPVAPLDTDQLRPFREYG